MSSSVSFRPMVSNFAPSMKGNDAKDLRVAISELNEDSRNQKMNDLSVMSRRMDLESKLYDTKVPSVEYVEDVKPAKSASVGEVRKNLYVTPPTLDATVRKFQDGKERSRVEQDAVLTNQMEQFAVNNKILHGLV